MEYTDGTLSLTMVSLFSRPFLKLGVRAVDILEAFYDVLRTPEPPRLSDMSTTGGNAYSDLKLTVTTYNNSGRIDVTPSGLGVHLRVMNALNGALEAKEHFALCEATARRALEGVEIAERLFRAQLWLKCTGGAAAVQEFLGRKGDAAFAIDVSRYREWTKKFSLEMNAVDASAGNRISFKAEPAVSLHDLFIEFGHTAIGAPVVGSTVSEQFDLAETEMLGLMQHIGLVSGNANGNAS